MSEILALQYISIHNFRCVLTIYKLIEYSNEAHKVFIIIVCYNLDGGPYFFTFKKIDGLFVRTIGKELRFDWI